MAKHSSLYQATLALGLVASTAVGNALGQSPGAGRLTASRSAVLIQNADGSTQAKQAEALPPSESAAADGMVVQSMPNQPGVTAWQLPIASSHCNYSACNLPPQPTTAGGGCQPCMTAIDCADSTYPQRWCDARPYNFGPLRQGEHLGPIRLPSTQDYRLRVGDGLRFVYSASQAIQGSQYRLMAGDEVLIDSVTNEAIRQGDLTRGVQIQPDGFLYLKQVGMVRAEGLTISQLRRNLETAYKDQGIIFPAIDVIPVRTNVKLTSIMASVDNRGGVGGQVFPDFVHQDGTVRLPSIGAVCVQGLTLDEVKREINLRYSEEVWGLEVEPIINAEAPHFVYIYGEVNRPDRYQLTGPTSVTQALAMAQGVRVGGNARQIVIFRRAEDWRMLATRVDIRGELLGKVPTPADEIWLRDSDLVIVPPTPIKLFDNFVQQVFTQGVYGIVPFNGFSITRFQNATIR
ncbi:MAG: polysaccharide biosynthesis/export family protein [Aureliella sp.]